MKKSFIKNIKENKRYNELLIDDLDVLSLGWYSAAIVLAPIIDVESLLVLFSASASLDIISHKMETNNLIFNRLEGKNNNDICYRLIPDNHIHKSSHAEYIREEY